MGGVNQSPFTSTIVGPECNLQVALALDANTTLKRDDIVITDLLDLVTRRDGDVLTPAC